jgi:menaquinone-specific isochorismate synthase
VITLFRSDKIHSTTSLKDAVYFHLKQLPRMISAVGNPQKIFRYEFLCEPLDILVWLHNNHAAAQQLYWSDRSGGFEVGGIGAADTVSDQSEFNYHDIFDYIEEHLSEHNPRLRYYGGFAFLNTPQHLEWKSFGRYCFMVPRFEIYRESQECLFAVNVAMSDVSENAIEALLSDLEKINFSPTTKYRAVPAIQKRSDCPNKDEWKRIFTQLETDERFQLEKIVLARKSTFEFDVALRPSALLKHLKDETPNCFHFCLQTSPHSAFLGASPERLYKKQGFLIESEALAGTSERGKTQSEDDHFASQLAQSSKNAFEHRCVVDGIHHAFVKICNKVDFDTESSVVKHKDWQHLLTRFYGELQEKAYNEKILALLHPTPAVAGSPRTEALKTIQHFEPFARGWYAGPIGYVGFEETEFAVAIRSGLINNCELAIFAGAGIVHGSQADDEWNEIENKLSGFMKVFDSHP